MFLSKARDELRVGLLSPTAARQIVRLPEGNQAEVLEAIRREALSGAELAGVVFRPPSLKECWPHPPGISR